MPQFYLKQVLQNNGWKQNVLIETNAQGIIENITENYTGNETPLNSLTLPGFQNAHSHAFQYAMAGLAEVHDINHSSDNFWSWREAMYNLALSITPDDLESIATMLYAEMVRHGYTNVAEFHYLHNDKNGVHYDDRAEMGARLISAAKTAGINITLIPIFYQKGGFGIEPGEKQRRFISANIEEYLKLFEASKKACEHYIGANVAIGVHSMRGVDPEVIKELAQNGPQGFPFHIHVSEQLKEIEDSINYLGCRPVEWMLDNIDLNERYHLVHATHLTKPETEMLAKSNANVVLCPTTEGNLGDGIFPLIEYQKHNGNWSIGTDSHVSLNPLEELRLLDYGQRLISHERNTFAVQTGNSGEFAINMATIAGRKAMGNFTKEYFKIGEPFNAVLYNSDSPLFAHTGKSNLASTIIYSTDASHNSGTIVNGNRICSPEHSNIISIKEKFSKTLKSLGNRL